MHQQPATRSCANEAIGGAHYGPVQIYLSKVTNATTAVGSSSAWFKVSELGLTSSNPDYWGTGMSCASSHADDTELTFFFLCRGLECKPNIFYWMNKADADGGSPFRTTVVRKSHIESFAKILNMRSLDRALHLQAAEHPCRPVPSPRRSHR